MKNIIFLILVLACFMAFGQQEIPPPSNCLASPDSIVIVQDDHTKLTVIGKGTMINYRTETIDGYTVLKNEKGIYEYAKLINGNIEPSGIKAYNPSERSAIEIAYLSKIQPSIQAPANPLKSSILDQVRKEMLNKTYPTTGNINVLALLIDFPDLKHQYSLADFDSLLNGLNYNNGKGSFKAYYTDASKGQLSITVDLVGWITAPNGYIHYGRDSGTVRAADLVRLAVDSAKLRGVNFSRYDNDNDGNVDGIMAIHSGPGAEVGSQTQYIWSHRWVLDGGTLGKVNYDGVWINDYMCNPEIYWNNAITGIGVICHEFGHNLGLPDLYDTDDSNGSSEGIGNWSVMAGGSWLGSGEQPGGFDAWSRIELVWEQAKLIDVNANSGIYSLEAATTTRDEIFRINTQEPSEYFLLENRQKIGIDAMLPGTGMAIWHINTFKTQGPRNRVNADHNLKGVDLEEADGLDDLDHKRNRGDNGDLFPGLTNNRTFNDTTYPHSKLYNSSNTGIDIRNITEHNQKITFGFGAPEKCGLEVLSASSGTFSDRSGSYGNYHNNMKCSWLIEPVPSVGGITLSFSSFKTEANNDVLIVYDGKDSTANILGTFSGQNIPANISSNKGEMYVEFITDNSIVDSGWTAHYTTITGIDSLVIEEDTIYLDSAITSMASFKLQTNLDWVVKNNTNWLMVSPQKGRMGAQITVIVTSENTSFKERSAVIYVSSANSTLMDSVLVIQKGSLYLLDSQPDTVVLSGTKGAKEIVSLFSNAPNWSISHGLSWLEISPMYGSGNEMLEIKASQNNHTGKVREGSFTILSAPLEPKVVVVRQEKDIHVGIDKKVGKDKFKIYPNPTVNEVNLMIDQSINPLNLELKLFNNLGAQLPLKIEYPTSHQILFNISDYPVGIYFLTLDYEGKRWSKKLTLIEK